MPEEFDPDLPIPYVTIGEQAAAVRSAINVYSKLETYSQAEVDAFFFNRAPDADVTAYIAAVEAALTTTIEIALPSAVNPKHKIYNFVTAEKAAGRWTLHKRIYLPIYNNAAASSVDMVSATSGTFTGLGSVTHAAGYVQGDGLSGYFDFGVSPSALSMTNDSAFLAALLLSPAPATGANRSVIGVRQSTPQDCRMFMPAAGGMSGIIMDSGASLTSTTDRLGILVSGRKSGTRFNGQRKSSGWSVLNTLTDASIGSVPTINFYGMAFNLSGVASGFVESRIGSMAVGLGLDATQSEEFTLNLKTLYESLTGLTLP